MGKLVISRKGIVDHLYVCTECLYEVPFKSNYCQECGENVEILIYSLEDYSPKDAPDQHPGDELPSEHESSKKASPREALRSKGK